MIVNYETYKSLGYSQIPEASFLPLIGDAEALVDKLTFGRVTAETATEENKRGLCRIAELYFAKEQSAGTNGAPVTSFKNGDYSENYDSAAYTSDNLNSKISQIVFAYFTPEQLYRGVYNVCVQ